MDIGNATSKELAQNFRVSVRRIQQLQQEGVIHSGTEKGKYNFLTSCVSYIHYLSDKIKSGTATINEERALKLRSDRKMSDLKFEEKKGLLIARAYSEVCIGKLGSEITKEHDRLLADFKQMGMSDKMLVQATEAVIAVRKRCADLRLNPEDFDEDFTVITEDDLEG